MEEDAEIIEEAAGPGRLLERAFFEASPETVAPRLLGKVLAHRTPAGLIAGRIVEVEAYLGPHNQPPDPAAHAFRGLTERNRVLFGAAGHAYVYAIYGRYFCMNISCEAEGRAGCVLLRALEPLMGLEEMARRRGVAFPLISAKNAEMNGAAPAVRQTASPFVGKRWSGAFPLITAESAEMNGARKGSASPSKPQKQDRGAEEAPGAKANRVRGAEISEAREKSRRHFARELTSGPSRLCQALGLTRATHNGADLLDPRSPLQVLDDGWEPEKMRTTPRIGIKEAADWPLRFFVEDNPCVSGSRRLNAAGKR